MCVADATTGGMSGQGASARWLRHVIVSWDRVAPVKGRLRFHRCSLSLWSRDGFLLDGRAHRMMEP